MKSDFTYQGVWWLPENPNEKFAGELKIDEKGSLMLTVLDSRNTLDYLRKIVEETFNVEIIQGYARNKYTKNDLAFTLFHNSVSSYNISGLAEFSFQSKYASTQKHYKTIDSLKIGNVFLETQLLNEWTDVSGIKKVKHKGIKKFKFTFDYNQPKPITLLKNKDFHIYIWFYANNKREENSFKLSERARIMCIFS